MPTLTVINWPCAMTNVDLNAFADALEMRKARALPGLKYLREWTDYYVLVDENGQIEPGGVECTFRLRGSM